VRLHLLTISTRRLVELKDGGYGKIGKTKARELIARQRIRAHKMGGKTLIDWRRRPRSGASGRQRQLGLVRTDRRLPLGALVSACFKSRMGSLLQIGRLSRQSNGSVRRCSNGREPHAPKCRQQFRRVDLAKRSIAEFGMQLNRIPPLDRRLGLAVLRVRLVRLPGAWPRARPPDLGPGRAASASWRLSRAAFSPTPGKVPNDMFLRLPAKRQR